MIRIPNGGKAILEPILASEERNKSKSKTKKRSKTLSEVKPVINTSINYQSFLEVSPMQKEVLPSHKLQQQ